MGNAAAYLIVNADDFGLTRGINAAIGEAHTRGIVTSASLLATGSAFEDAVARAIAHPALGVGVHLCLDEERPVLPPSEIPSLVDARGRFRPRAEVLRRLFRGRLRREEIEAEYRAQLARVFEAGLRPTHVDSHGHLHAYPPLGRLTRAVAASFGIRRTRKAHVGGWVNLAGAGWRRIALVTSIALIDRLSHRLVPRDFLTPDRQLGTPRSGRIDAAWVCRAVATLRPGSVTELVLHPGPAADAETQRHYGHWGYGWDSEFQAAVAPEVRDAVRAHGVRLVHYGQLGAL